MINEERDCLRNALGIAIAAMKRHDRTDIDYESHPAGLCLVDFASEIELCQNALDSSFECDECNGSGTYYIDGEPQKCICSESQEDYVLNAVTFSAQEVATLKEGLDNYWKEEGLNKFGPPQNVNLSKRELADFKRKLGL